MDNSFHGNMVGCVSFLLKNFYAVALFMFENGLVYSNAIFSNLVLPFDLWAMWNKARFWICTSLIRVLFLWGFYFSSRNLLVSEKLFAYYVVEQLLVWYYVLLFMQWNRLRLSNAMKFTCVHRISWSSFLCIRAPLVMRKVLCKFWETCPSIDGDIDKIWTCPYFAMKRPCM